MKNFVLLSQYKSNSLPPFGIVVEETDKREDAEKLFMELSSENEIAVLLDSSVNKVIQDKGEIDKIKIVLDVNSPHWHK